MPRFRKSIEIVSYSKHAKDSTMYVSFENLRLVDKNTRPVEIGVGAEL